jgi:hypothetical protein
LRPLKRGLFLTLFCTHQFSSFFIIIDNHQHIINVIINIIKNSLFQFFDVFEKPKRDFQKCKLNTP